MTINQKKSLVAFYISKFNDDAFRELGYSGPVSKAMDDLSVRITGPGVEPNAYLRRRRDEFDVFFDNGRVGQHNRNCEISFGWNNGRNSGDKFRC